MNDKKWIITGLVVFLIIVLFPFWYNRGKAVPPPEVKLTEKAKAAKECVLSKEYMRAEHMQILDLWREVVVRGGQRTYTNATGKSFVMSLSNTCMDCHSNKADFCDQCHNYVSVRPYCWDCHIEPPKEKS
jgi:hypothetical protein